MEKRTEYDRAPADIAEAIQQAEVVADFLPPPDRLVLKGDTVKVTLNLNRNSVEFFKSQARKTGVPYQHMIRRVLELYTERYQPV